MSVLCGVSARLQRMGSLLLLLASGPGCGRLPAIRPAGEASRWADPARVYASYGFDPSPKVLNFGVQPVWVPACVIWEVMARDVQLQEDLHRGHFRLDAYPFFKGRDLNNYMRSGQLQGGMVGDLPALKAAAESEVRIVSLIQQGPCSIVARDARSVEDLRGRRIGYAPGSNAHYVLLHVLREHDILPREVQLVRMDVLDMAPALAERQIDAFAAWEPTPTQAILDHPGFEVLVRADARGYLYFTRRFFERQPAVVRAVIASEIRALRWLRLNDKNVYIASRWAREQAVAFGGGELPISVYDIDRLARRDILRVPEAPRLLPQLLSPGPTAFLPGELPDQFRVSRAFGLIDARADWNRVRNSFAIDVVPQILTSPSHYRLDELRLGPRLGQMG
jgi:hypothetical protein